jgi:hypothetical protein
VKYQERMHCCSLPEVCREKHQPDMRPAAVLNNTPMLTMPIPTVAPLPKYISSTTPAQYFRLVRLWLYQPVRGMSAADWLGGLGDIPEAVRKLHMQYERPGYIRQGRVVARRRASAQSTPGRARCRFRDVVP